MLISVTPYTISLQREKANDINVNMNRWTNQNTNTSASYEVGVHRNCTAHHLAALQDTDLFGDASCLLESVRPNTKLSKSIAAATSDPNHMNIRTAMKARVNKCVGGGGGGIGMGDFLFPVHGGQIFHGRVDALFDQESRTCCDGPMAALHLASVTTELPRNWKLKWPHELCFVAVCDFSCRMFAYMDSRRRHRCA